MSEEKVSFFAGLFGRKWATDKPSPTPTSASAAPTAGRLLSAGISLPRFPLPTLAAIPGPFTEARPKENSSQPVRNGHISVPSSSASRRSDLPIEVGLDCAKNVPLSPVARDIDRLHVGVTRSSSVSAQPPTSEAAAVAPKMQPWRPQRRSELSVKAGWDFNRPVPVRQATSSTNKLQVGGSRSSSPLVLQPSAEDVAPEVQPWRSQRRSESSVEDGWDFTRPVPVSPVAHGTDKLLVCGSKSSSAFEQPPSTEAAAVAPEMQPWRSQRRSESPVEDGWDFTRPIPVSPVTRGTYKLQVGKSPAPGTSKRSQTSDLVQKDQKLEVAEAQQSAFLEARMKAYFVGKDPYKVDQGNRSALLPSSLAPASNATTVFFQDLGQPSAVFQRRPDPPVPILREPMDVDDNSGRYELPRVSFSS